MKLYNDDCFNIFPQLEDKSIDLVLCDMPYGTTACKWDTVIDLECMWKELKRVVKDSAIIILTASQPFTTVLINSNFNNFKHCLVWDKGAAGNFVQAKRMHLKVHEDIILFNYSKTLGVYNPQMIKKDIVEKARQGKKDRIAIPMKERSEYKNKIFTHSFPNSILKFSSRQDKERGLHPTQKPVMLMEYLIKTYSNEGDSVLDFCMGSGTTGVACRNLNRNFIGIEKEENYFSIAKGRIRIFDK